MFNETWPSFVSENNSLENKLNYLKKEILKDMKNDNVKKENKQTINNIQDSKLAKLQALNAKMQQFDEIQFKIYANNLVFADGNPNSKLMLIGEAPGEEEDKLGIPFVGKSGQLLTSMLETIKDENGKYDRSHYYITNIIPWRPPGNRTPTVQEASSMLPFVFEHIDIIDPLLIVLVGSVAFKAIASSHLSITQAQGNAFDLEINGKMRKVFVIYHPSYALRISSKKRDLWLSLLKMHELYLSLK